MLIWSGLVLLFATQAWWASFGLRDRSHWDFLSFAIILLQMILLYMLSAIIFPEVWSDQRVDLIEHFERHRSIFYGFLIAMLMASVLKELVLSHHLPSPENLGFHVAFAATALAGILIANNRVQLWIALIGAAEFLLYIALLFARL